jgi:hypothetical protein
VITRHLIAAVLAAALALPLALAPTAALAQEGDDTTPTEESTTSSWEALGDVFGELLATFVGSRAELDGIGDDDPGREAAQERFDTLVASVAGVVSDFFGTLAFTRIETDALASAQDGEGANGEAVSTLAHCAPRGSFKALIEGMAHHGEYVTAAAHGETVQLNVPTLEASEGEDGQTTYAVTPAEAPTDFDLTTTEDAEGLCAALDVVYQARLLQLEVAWEDVDTHRDARVLAREQCQIQRLRARNGAGEDADDFCAQLRQRIRDLHAQERADARADRDAARGQAQADREAARAERAAARAERAEARGQARTAHGNG